MLLKNIFGAGAPFTDLKCEYKQVPLKRKGDINYEVQWRTADIEKDGHKVMSSCSLSIKWESYLDWDHVNRSERFHQKFGFECELDHEAQSGRITWINQALGAIREELIKLNLNFESPS